MRRSCCENTRSVRPEPTSGLGRRLRGFGDRGAIARMRECGGQVFDAADRAGLCELFSEVEVELDLGMELFLQSARELAAFAVPVEQDDDAPMVCGEFVRGLDHVLAC